MKNKNNALDCAFDMLFDEAVQQVGLQEARTLGATAAEEPQVSFSDAHTQKMKAVFRKEKRKPQLKKAMAYTKRVACVLLAVALISGITIGSVEAWRSKFLNFIFNEDQPNTDYRYAESKDTTYSNDSISLGYIPAGFVLEYDHSSTRDADLRFTNQNTYFSVMSADTDLKNSVDTENAMIENLLVNEKEAVYITKENLNILVWSDDIYSYVIYGNISKDELLKIAKKINC